MANTAAQFLDRLLQLVLDLRADHAAMQAVLRSIAETHPNRPALLARLAHHQKFAHEVEQGQPLSEEELARRQHAIAEWREWIAGAP